MKLSEVAELLTLMAAFDRRTIGEADVMAWGSLDTIQRTDLPTAKRAVIRFFEQVPPDRGEAPYLDPRELKRQIRAVRQAQDIEEARERAKRPQLEAPTGAYRRPEDFGEQVAASAAEAKAWVRRLQEGATSMFRIPE
jgi:hypothetical protein